LLIILVTSIITVSSFPIFSHAQSVTIQATKYAVANGNVNTCTDTTGQVSGGQYIHFGSPNNSGCTPANGPTLTPGTSASTSSVSPTPTPTSVAPTPLPLMPQASVSTDPIILAAGDIACGKSQYQGAPQNPQSTNACWQFNTAALIKNLISSKQNIQGVLELGDIQYPGTDYTDFAKFFGDAQQGWGDPQIFNISHPVPGNHDYTGYTINPLNVQTPAAYLNFFGNKATPNGKTYYSYNIRNWHIIALDSNCTDMASSEFPSNPSNLVNCDQNPGSDEKSWLQQDLTQYGKTGTIQSHTCVMAYWHHPVFSSWFDMANFNDKWMMWAWHALLTAHADLIVNGHAHMYERFQPVAPVDTSNSPPVDMVNGVPELIAGTGGRNLDPFHSTAPNEVVRNNNTMGVLQLTLHSKSVDFQFIPDPQPGNGTFTDSGTYQCH
jgi:hypothetical protein